MIVLGIETSCDETAAAIVSDEGGEPCILSNQVLSQHEDHRPFGGIVPEVAARAHLLHVDRLIKNAVDEAGVAFADLDGIAATGGPGLIGGVIVGVMSGKAIAAVHDLPFIAVNHLEGHALTARLTNKVPFPYLLLLMSGGHCQILAVEGVGTYQRLGTTVDDAIGEAFDKTAKMLDLGYPGGPALEKAAQNGHPDRFKLPRPMRGREGCDFSFSGLKTAVRQTIQNHDQSLTATDVADLAASFHAAVADVLRDRCQHGIERFRRDHGDDVTLVVAGGVAANRTLREALGELCDVEQVTLICPPIELCTDNAAMIAWAGIERLKQGSTDDLSFAPRPRWPLDPDAPAAIGAGVKA